MADQPVQLTGLLKLGADAGTATDVSAFVSKMIVHVSRSEVAIPATLANNTEGVAAGSFQYSLEIQFYSGLAATSLWAKLYTAALTDSAELYFEGQLNSGAVGVDNPKWSGKIVVLTVDTGADVGTLRQQSQTYKSTPAGFTKVVA